MKLSPHWLRDFVDFKLDYRRLADELTLAGIAVEGVSGDGDNTVFEMEITTNRPDAMNHYGVAREISALYDLPLRPMESKLPVAKDKSDGATAKNGGVYDWTTQGALQNKVIDQALFTLQVGYDAFTEKLLAANTTKYTSELKHGETVLLRLAEPK